MDTPKITSVLEWGPISSAPKDGTVVLLLVTLETIVMAKWQCHITVEDGEQKKNCGWYIHPGGNRVYDFRIRAWAEANAPEFIGDWESPYFEAITNRLEILRKSLVTSIRVSAIYDMVFNIVENIIKEITEKKE